MGVQHLIREPENQATFPSPTHLPTYLRVASKEEDRLINPPQHLSKLYTPRGRS